MTRRECEKLLPTPTSSDLKYRLTVDSTLHLIYFVVLSIASIGILPVITLWHPWIYSIIARKPTDSIEDADFIIIYDITWEECQIHRDSIGVMRAIWFIYRTDRYLWHYDAKSFEKCESTWDEPIAASCDRWLRGGWTTERAHELRMEYGENNCLDGDNLSFLEILGQKFVHPFYMAQIISISIYLHDHYFTYALSIFALSTASIVYECILQIQNERSLIRFRIDCLVPVVRDQQVKLMHAQHLVVGDIIQLTEGQVPADLRLISGDCIIDESSLMGNAMHVGKHAPKDTWCVQHNCVSAGTTVRHQSVDCVGVVMAIGFATTKGKLFRSILYPAHVQSILQRNNRRFLIALVGFGLIAALHVLFELIPSNLTTSQVILKALNVFTTTIPPALPLVLSVTLGLALARLRTKGITCTSTQAINYTGNINCICFDKTGTLTKRSMEFVGVHMDHTFYPSLRSLKMNRDVLRGMATCHSLTEFHTEGEVKLVGDPIEEAMVAASGYKIRGNICKMDQEKLCIKQRYPFDSTFRRSTVIMENLMDGEVVAYSKGSPATILSLCTNYNESLPAIASTYTLNGHYCIALAKKSISNDIYHRDEIECSMTFLALLIFKNPVKANASRVIRLINAAQLDLRMITGDNILTAIHVCREIDFTLSRILCIEKDEETPHRLIYKAMDSRDELAYPLERQDIDWLVATYEFALTGPALDILKDSFSECIEKIIENTRVFASTQPEQKTWIIEQLSRQGYCVAMCGDGANDCGALKAAHVGLALSNSETALVAPFTSHRYDVEDLIELLFIGRSAFTTSYIAIKYMIMYSVIQLLIEKYLYSHGSELSNNEYFIDNFGIILGLSLLMILTNPANRLSHHMPTASLYAPSMIFSIVGHTMIFVGTSWIAIHWMKQHDWYCSLPEAIADSMQPNATCFSYKPNNFTGLTPYTYENSVLWYLGHTQYVVMALSFNLINRFRKPVYTNYSFLGYAIGCIVLETWLLLSSATWPASVFKFVPLPMSFRYTLIYLACGNAAVSAIWEIIAIMAFGMFD